VEVLTCRTDCERQAKIARGRQKGGGSHPGKNRLREAGKINTPRPRVQLSHPLSSFHPQDLQRRQLPPLPPPAYLRLLPPQHPQCSIPFLSVFRVRQMTRSRRKPLALILLTPPLPLPSSLDSLSPNFSTPSSLDSLLPPWALAGVSGPGVAAIGMWRASSEIIVEIHQRARILKASSALSTSGNGSKKRCWERSTKRVHSYFEAAIKGRFRLGGFFYVSVFAARTSLSCPC